MRGEVVERFNTQFIYDPPRMVTATSGVIDQQGRPFTHAYEIYLEKATLFFDYAALAKVGDAVTPLDRALGQRQGVAAEAGFRRSGRCVRGRVGRSGARGPQQHAFAAVGRRVGPRRRRPLPEADRIGPPRPRGQRVTRFMAGGRD